MGFHGFFLCPGHGVKLLQSPSDVKKEIQTWV
nr:MAG TPA: hypothetical protein [Caudoviricetes sp.]